MPSSKQKGFPSVIRRDLEILKKIPVDLSRFQDDKITRYKHQGRVLKKKKINRYTGYLMHTVQYIAF